MHGSLDEEDVLQQLAHHLTVQLRSGADDIVQIDVPLEHHQHTGSGAAHFAAGHHRLVDGLFHLGDLLLRAEHPHQPQVLATQPLQYLADLRLEQNDQRQNAPVHHVAENIFDSPQIQCRRQAQRQQEDRHTLQNIFRSRTLDQRQQLIYQENNDGDIHEVRDLQER